MIHVRCGGEVKSGSAYYSCGCEFWTAEELKKDKLMGRIR